MANKHEQPPQVALHLPQSNGEEPYPPQHHDSTVGIGDHGADSVIEFENKCASECAEGCLCHAKIDNEYETEEARSVLAPTTGKLKTDFGEMTPSQKKYLAQSKALGDDLSECQKHFKSFRPKFFDDPVKGSVEFVNTTMAEPLESHALHNNELLNDGPDYADGPDWDGWDERAKEIQEGFAEAANANVKNEAWNSNPNSGNPKDLIGIKKPNLFLVPPAAEIYLALAMQDGAAKYGPYNWRENKVKASVYVAACKRHIGKWVDGLENAEDSGAPELAHAMACLGILADAIETGNLIDDRPLPGAAAKLLERYTTS
jgi:hypothetical protein